MAQYLSQGSGTTFISNDSGCQGFDLSSGSKWIYPENYPRREYQFSIVQTALYNNTLVCLPTGLGKTFIAAVVMFNFWRWYPRGRVVFLAPTKPLVAQQIHACHEIMGIPSDQTIELTGAVNQTKRRQAWTQKRVIFATPQTFQKDLQNDCVPCQLIKCVVIDEAHKALGKHSYCEIVRMLNEKNNFFRVLALSATPGSKIDHVREVIQNLLISELELRDDTSSDITPYTNNRSMEKIIVSLGKDLIEFKERYIRVMDPHVRILVQNHVLQGSTANITKGRIFMLMQQYDNRPQKAKNHGTIKKTLTILLTMYHAYELLIKHGLRAFYNFYTNHSDKFWLDSELELQLLLEDIKRYIGDFPVVEPLPDGSIPDVPNDIIFGHNKFDTLQELLEQHFRKFASENKSTRAIVFVEYRDIVNEVYVLLLQKRPLIRPQMFVGQAGQKQKQQLAALEDFRNNQVNVLISTSVGEEGLDVGEVDLIICFDISTSTPTRLVQRMGRTGRKRNGRVVLLLTEGKEVQTLNQALCKKDTMNARILQSSNIASSLYQSSPRMVPDDLNPECLTMFIKALPKIPKTKASSAGKAAKKMKEPNADTPVDKKKRGGKKKTDVILDESFEPQPSTSKAKPSPKKSGSTQSSLMRFLTTTDNRRLQQSSTSHSTNSEIDSAIDLSEEFQIPPDSTDPYAHLRPEDVRLLSSDSHALDFLTLCAMKRSTMSETLVESLISEDRRVWLPIIENNHSSEEDTGDIEVSKDPFEGLSLPSPSCLEAIERLTICDENEEHDDSLLSYWPEDSVHNVDDDYRRTRSPTILEHDYGDEEFQYVESKYTRCQSHNNDSFQEQEEFLDSAGDPAAVSAGAAVEVDFEAILDEATSSSEITIHPDQHNSLGSSNNNIFDELLEESDEDEVDLFADLGLEETLRPASPEQRKETIPRLSTPEQLPVLRIRGKRSASRSPCEELMQENKRLRLLPVATAGSSDSEAVPGTPPKSKLISWSKLCAASQSESKPDAVTDTATDDAAAAPATVFYPDSDEDLFDDLDFETQFSPDINNKSEETIVEQQKPSDESIVKEPLTTSWNFKEVKKDTANEIVKEEVMELDELKGRVAEIKYVDEKIAKTEVQINSTLEHDLEFEDWDDFDLAPVIVPKANISQEKISSFFDPNTRTNSGNSLKEPSISKAQSTLSTGWISSSGWQPKKALSLKNLSSNATESKKLTTNGLDIQKTYRVEVGGRPRLQLFNLNNASRDKDGFAVPAQLVHRTPTVEKENARPKAAVLELTRRKEMSPKGSISPRFRKYHSESSLCKPTSEIRRRKKERRRRLAREFIEEEAEVSSDCDTSAESSDEDEAHDLSNFVSYTQVQDDYDEDMQAHYLQSIRRNDLIRPGAFLIKEIKHRNHDVFSQPVSQIEDSYLHDSFCVGDETQMDANNSDNSLDDCYLDSIESVLESRRQKLKKKQKMKFKELENKRKQNKNGKDLNNSNESVNHSSSEDETEALRRQVLEESMRLKK